MFRRTMRDKSFPEALHYEIIVALDQLCKDVAGLPAEAMRVGSLGKNTVRFVARKTLFHSISKFFPSISDSSLFRLRAILQAETQRLTHLDAKLTASVVTRDECVADLLIGSPQGDEGSPLIVGTGAPQRATQATPFRRPMSSLLMPFSAALYRTAMDQYDAFTQSTMSLVVDGALPQPRNLLENDTDSAHVTTLRVTFNRLQSIMGDVLRSEDVAADFVDNFRHSATDESEVALSEIAASLRQFYFPPHVRSRCAEMSTDSQVTTDSGKLLDASRKSVTLLRSLQR
jgi:hypothetical protein